jgi:hypothetical protein
MTRAEELAWAAGVFEGEGCITVTNGRLASGAVRRYPELALAMSDVDVVERVQVILGGIGTLRVQARGVNKPIWYLKVRQYENVERVLRLFLPYFGARRKEKALEVLALCDVLRRTPSSNAPKLTPATALLIRDRMDAGENGALVARDFGVHPVTAYQIKNRKSWRSLDTQVGRMEVDGGKIPRLEFVK